MDSGLFESVSWTWIAWGAALAVSLLVPAAALATALHAILTKRDSRAAAAWLGLVALVPLLGAVLYWALGINRIHRRATEVRTGRARPERDTRPLPEEPDSESKPLLPPNDPLAPLARLGDLVLGQPLRPGHRVLPLHSGDEAYPAMLEAIEGASSSVALSTFIFDADRTGISFADALAGAEGRGVAVRVLVDSVGAHYSNPTIFHDLSMRGIRHATFLPPRWPWKLPFMNLRNHRKILVIDGTVGFTGGMNIRGDCVLADHSDFPTRDLHFRVEGPVVEDMLEVFALDWSFTTGERLEGPAWSSSPEEVGAMLARSIPDGPDEDFQKVEWLLLGGIDAARERLWIRTPYFLPETPLLVALTLASLRGVDVRILLPSTNNHPAIHWASRSQWDELLRKGCRIRLAPPPFDHSKLLLIDGRWTLLGSANLDPRSLRLNFEYNLEVWDEDLAVELGHAFERDWAEASVVSLGDLENRSWPGKLRDGAARLFIPYL